MDNLTIDNALLRPRLADGWQLDSRQQPPSINNPAENKRFDINEIAVMILSACDGEQTVEAIIEQLQLQFPEADSEIPADVEAVLSELTQKQVLSFITAQSDESFDVPEKTPQHDKKKLCIGMATYDDYDGVYFSVQAIRLYHSEILDQIEIVVIDNHPDGPCASALKQLEHWVPNFRYVPCEKIRGTAVRDFIFREANADYVLCLDSHVMVEAGAIAQLIEYFDAHPDSPDFLQGPLLNDDLRNISTHFVPGWSQGMYGTWGTDTRAVDQQAPAFDVPMQGLGLFACARSAWTGFNPRFSGFGGEEGYIHEKFRQAGGRTLCLPFLRWLHRFNRPMGTRYTVSWDDRIRNYLIGRDELGMDDQDVIEHFNEHIGESNTQAIAERVRQEMTQPYYYFDALYCLLDEQDTHAWISLQRSLEAVGILHRTTAIDMTEYAQKSEQAKVLAYRDLVDQAQQSGYRSILIFDIESAAEMIAAFAQDANTLTQALAQESWALLYPLACEADSDDAPGSSLLAEVVAPMERDSPIALHQPVFTQLLQALPETAEAISSWLAEQNSLANYFDQSVSKRYCLSLK